jgi:hypothetical protein
MIRWAGYDLKKGWTSPQARDLFNQFARYEAENRRAIRERLIRLYDLRKTRPEDSPTFHVKY